MTPPTNPDDFPYMVEIRRHDEVVREWGPYANLPYDAAEKPYYRFATERQAQEKLGLVESWRPMYSYALYCWHEGRWFRLVSTTQECPT